MSSLGEFSRQPLMMGLVFHVVSIFCLHRALNKTKAFCYGKIFAHGKFESGRKSLIRKKGKKKKNRPTEERKSAIL